VVVSLDHDRLSESASMTIMVGNEYAKVGDQYRSSDYYYFGELANT
jgi:hypothetical protein